MLQKIDWSECLYLYQVYQSYQAYQLLNQLYFEVLSKLAYKKINKIDCAYDFYDFVNLGHPKFIEFINTKSYKNKEFVYRATAYITNFFRNEIRKVSNKTNALNSLKCDQNNVFKDLNPIDFNYTTSYLDEIRDVFEQVLAEDEKNEINKQIYELKFEEYSFVEIADKLGLTIKTVQYRWKSLLEKVRMSGMVNDQII